MEKRNKEHTGETFKEENFYRTQEVIFYIGQGLTRLEDDSSYLAWMNRWNEREEKVRDR